MSESVHSNQVPKRSEWILVNYHVALGCIGAVTCFAWLFSMLGSTIFIPYALMPGPITGLVHVSLIIGCLFSLYVCWFLSDYFSRHRLVLVSVSAAVTLLSFAGLMGSASLEPWWVMIFSFGLGSGCMFLYVLYGEFICVFFQSDMRQYVIGIFAASLLLCFGILLAGPQTNFLLPMIFAVLSLVIYLVLYRLEDLKNLPFIDKKTSDSRSCVVWRSYLATIAAGLAAGFGLGCILLTQRVSPWINFIVVPILVIFTLVLFIDSLRNNKIKEATAMRYFLPIAAVVAFPMIFVPAEVRFVFATLLLCGSLLPITCSLSAISRHIGICKLSPIRAFAFGRTMPFLGLLLGGIISFVGFHEEFAHWFDGLASVFSITLFLLLVIFAASFVMTEDNYPEESRFVVAARSNDEADGSSPTLVAPPGIPIHKIMSDISTEATADQSSDRKAIFYLKCDAIAERYGLSERQKEVLVMLAKGRNADYITEKLVISTHTAKAHIYNIYQKTGVHSRQELMDLVEEIYIPESNS